MRIEEIKEKYKDEWVLIEILGEDELGMPREGKILAHSKTRNDIYKESRKTKEKYTYQFYTGEIPKEGYAVAFIH